LPFFLILDCFPFNLLIKRFFFLLSQSSSFKPLLSLFFSHCLLCSCQGGVWASLDLVIVFLLYLRLWRGCLHFSCQCVLDFSTTTSKVFVHFLSLCSCFLCVCEGGICSSLITFFVFCSTMKEAFMFILLQCFCFCVTIKKVFVLFLSPTF